MKPLLRVLLYILPLISCIKAPYPIIGLGKFGTNDNVSSLRYKSPNTEPWASGGIYNSNESNKKSIDFINELNIFYKNIPGIIPKYVNNCNKNHIERLEDLYNSNLLSKEMCSIIRKEARDSSLREYVYEVDFLKDSPKTKFRVIVNRKGEENIDKMISYYMFLIYLRNKYNLQNIPFSKDIYIYMLPQNIPKKLSNPITAYDVNSGCTFVYDNILGNTMYLWRQDEFFKVLLHETLHSIHFDKLLHEKWIKSSDIKKFKNINCLKIHEAYNELGAIYFSAMLKAKMELPNASNKVIEQNLNNLLKKELRHSIDNVCILMKTFDIKDFCDFLKTNKLKQSAPIFSYVVLKTFLLWLFLNNETSLSIHKFISLGFTDNPKKSFFDLIDNFFYNNKFINIINARYKVLITGYKPAKLKEGGFMFTIFD